MRTRGPQCGDRRQEPWVRARRTPQRSLRCQRSTQKPLPSKGFGGGSGIRTHGTPQRGSTVFETAAAEMVDSLGFAVVGRNAWCRKGFRLLDTSRWFPSNRTCTDPPAPPARPEASFEPLEGVPGRAPGRILAPSVPAGPRSAVTERGRWVGLPRHSELNPEEPFSGSTR